MQNHKDETSTGIKYWEVSKDEETGMLRAILSSEDPNQELKHQKITKLQNTTFTHYKTDLKIITEPKRLTSILNMAATLNGNALGAVWNCGNTGNWTVWSTEGDLAITSVMYDCAFEFENAEFWTKTIEHKVV